MARPRVGCLSSGEADTKFLARPLDRSAWFATIVGKSSPKSMRLTLGRDWSTRPILSLFIALRFLFLLKIENWQFAEPSKPRVPELL